LLLLAFVAVLAVVQAAAVLAVALVDIPLKLTSEEKDSQLLSVPFDSKSREAQEICSVSAHRRITNHKAQIVQSCGEPETWSTQHIVQR
jgi:hypothetical protein